MVPEMEPRRDCAGQAPPLLFLRPKSAQVSLPKWVSGRKMHFLPLTNRNPRTLRGQDLQFWITRDLRSCKLPAIKVGERATPALPQPRRDTPRPARETEAQRRQRPKPRPVPRPAPQGPASPAGVQGARTGPHIPRPAHTAPVPASPADPAPLGASAAATRVSLLPAPFWHKQGPASRGTSSRLFRKGSPT